jgi:hypothetical protein
MKIFSIALGMARGSWFPASDAVPPALARQDAEAGGVVTWLLLAILAISVGAGGAMATFGWLFAP